MYSQTLSSEVDKILLLHRTAIKVQVHRNHEFILLFIHSIAIQTNTHTPTEEDTHPDTENVQGGSTKIHLRFHPKI